MLRAPNRPMRLAAEFADVKMPLRARAFGAAGIASVPRVANVGAVPPRKETACSTLLILVALAVALACALPL
eukprot:1885670-Heterocapsa_arctica.AAC.1